MKWPTPNKLQQVAVQVLLHGPLSEILKADPQHRMAHKASLDCLPQKPAKPSVDPSCKSMLSHRFHWCFPNICTIHMIGMDIDRTKKWTEVQNQQPGNKQLLVSPTHTIPLQIMSLLHRSVAGHATRGHVICQKKGTLMDFELIWKRLFCVNIWIHAMCQKQLIDIYTKHIQHYYKYAETIKQLYITYWKYTHTHKTHIVIPLTMRPILPSKTAQKKVLSRAVGIHGFEGLLWVFHSDTPFLEPQPCPGLINIHFQSKCNFFVLKNGRWEVMWMNSE